MEQPTKAGNPSKATPIVATALLAIVALVVYLVAVSSGSHSHRTVGWEDSGPDVRSTDMTDLVPLEQRQFEALTNPYQPYPPLAVVGTDITPAGPTLEILAPANYRVDHQPPLTMEDIITAVGEFEELAGAKTTYQLPVYFGHGKSANYVELPFRLEVTQQPQRYLLLLGDHTKDLLGASREAVQPNSVQTVLFGIPAEFEGRELLNAKSTTLLGFDPGGEFVGLRLPLQEPEFVRNPYIGQDWQWAGSNLNTYETLCELTLKLVPTSFSVSRAGNNQQALEDEAEAASSSIDEICTKQATALTAARSPEAIPYAEYRNLLAEEGWELNPNRVSPTNPNLQPVSFSTYEQYSESRE